MIVFITDFHAKDSRKNCENWKAICGKWTRFFKNYNLLTFRWKHLENKITIEVKMVFSIIMFIKIKYYIKGVISRIIQSLRIDSALNNIEILLNKRHPLILTEFWMNMGDTMKYNIKFVYALCISIFIVGLVTTLSWSYTSRWFGLILLLISLFSIYYINQKDQKTLVYSNKINLKRSLLGFLLIIVDVLYNLIQKDTFMYFDYGMISAGLIIVLLNINCLKFLKLDEQKIAFSTYFIFITVSLYGFLFEGLDLLLKSTGEPSNPFWDWFSKSTVTLVIPILNLIAPTTSDNATINLNGFSVSVGYACSGIESISVFFSAVIAYFASTRGYSYIQIIKYLLTGSFLLYLVNLLRITIIISVGYYFGIEKMMMVHTHLGWIFFVLSMTLFWYLIFNEKSNSV